jgi:Mg2+/Co2+ transporter CorC
MTKQNIEQIERIIEEKKQSLTDSAQKELFDLMILRDDMVVERASQTFEATVKSLCDSSNSKFDEIKQALEGLRTGQGEVKREISKLKQELGLNGYGNKTG